MTNAQVSLEGKHIFLAEHVPNHPHALDLVNLGVLSLRRRGDHPCSILSAVLENGERIEKLLPAKGVGVREQDPENGAHPLSTCFRPPGRP